MRILLVSSSSGSHGGGEIYLHYLGQALSAMGHTVGLWTSSHERMDGLVGKMQSYAEILREPYENTYDLPGRSLQAYWQPGVRSSARRSWRAWKPDIIHLNKQNLEDGLDLVRALRGFEIPYVTTIHITQSAEYLKAAKARWRDTMARWALHQHDGPFVTVSDQRGAELSCFLRESQVAIETIYNGIPSAPEHPGAREKLRDQLGLTAGDVLVTMVGRLTAQKSPDIFLEQATRATALYPKARFLWIGSGEDAEKFDQTVANHRLTERVLRIEWQENVAEWLDASDIYLHTAAYEGLPLSLLEALGAGLPCVTSPGVLAEALPLRHSPVLSYQKDWFHLLASAEQRLRAGRACRGLFETHFTAAQMAQCYESLYHSLAKERLAA